MSNYEEILGIIKNPEHERYEEYMFQGQGSIAWVS